MQSLRLIRGGTVPTDEEIKQMAQTDRRSASDWIVRKYREPLFHHAAYILKDYQEAIDVAQEVFIKSMREPRFFDEEFKMKAWLYRVTSNLCFNLVRDRRRRSAILDTFPIKKSTDPGQIELVFHTERQSEVLNAMDQLTENHKKILMLRYYNDLSYSEISDALEIKLGTVMSRLSRAKRQLMEVMGELGVSSAT